MLLTLFSSRNFLFSYKKKILKTLKAQTIHVFTFFLRALFLLVLMFLRCASDASILMLLNLASSSFRLSKLKVPSLETPTFIGSS